MQKREHQCLNLQWSKDSTWWVYDARGIPLCRVCEKCVDEKLSRYKSEILSGYGDADVDESIEENY